LGNKREKLTCLVWPGSLEKNTRIRTKISGGKKSERKDIRICDPGVKTEKKATHCIKKNDRAAIKTVIRGTTWEEGGR